MPDYPAYVQRMLDEAHEQGQWYCGQYDAAARCFDILALFPNHQAAATIRHYRWSRPIAPPATPKRYDPAALLFDPAEEFEDGETIHGEMIYSERETTS